MWQWRIYVCYKSVDEKSTLRLNEIWHTSFGSNTVLFIKIDFYKVVRRSIDSASRNYIKHFILISCVVVVVTATNNRSNIYSQTKLKSQLLEITIKIL